MIAVNFKADDLKKNSNVMDISMRALDIMGNKISEESIEKSDFLLTIGTDKTGFFDTRKIDMCYQNGYNAVKENLNNIIDAIK